MYWEDAAPETNPPVSDTVLDAVFGVVCKRLPVDHAYALSHAVQAELPWFAVEPHAALHTIHVAESGNGWMRPEDFIHPSRRTKLILRLPKHRIADAQSLIGKKLNIAGEELIVGAMTTRALSNLTTLFARYIATEHIDEQAFLNATLIQLRAAGIHPKKMLCGIAHSITTPQGPLKTRSLMLAELTQPESVLLQQQGIGAHRALGCGVFIPHKDIQELK